MSDDQEPQAPADDAPDAGDGAEMSIGAQFRAMAEERAQHAASGENDPESVEIAGVRYKRPPGSGMTISELRAAFEKMNPAHTQRPPLAHSIAQVMSTLAGTQDAAKAVHTFTASMLPEINTAQSMLSALHWDWAERMKELNVGMGIAVGEKFRAADAFRGLIDFAELWAARNRRARDMAQPHITDAHVRESVGKIEWDQFLAAQREGDTPDTPTDDVLETLATQLAHSTNAPLREELTRELLYIGWAHVAGSLGYDGPNTEPFTYDDPETGETQTFTATAELVTDYLFTQELSTPEDWAALSREYVERNILAGILESLERGAPAPILNPAFRDGIGHVPSHRVFGGAQVYLALPQEQRQTGDDGRPVHTERWRGGVAYYGPDPEYFRLTADAHAAVARLDNEHTDVFDYIYAKWIANQTTAQMGPYGGFYVGVDEILDERGIKKQTAGGHRSDDVTRTAEVVRHLSRQTVRGEVTAYPPGKKPQQLIIEGPLLVISHMVKRRALDGTERPIAFYLRPGDWALELWHCSPQYALAMQSVLRLNRPSDYIAKQIGRWFLRELRIRADEGNWAQPFTVGKMLEGAGVLLDLKNPGRQRERIEAAWNLLTDPAQLQRPIWDDWRYAGQIPPTKGRGSGETWRLSGIVITPAPILLEHYIPIAERKATRTERARRRKRTNTRPATA